MESTVSARALRPGRCAVPGVVRGADITLGAVEGGGARSPVRLDWAWNVAHVAARLLRQGTQAHKGPGGKGV